MQPSSELRRVAGKLHGMRLAMEEVERENVAERRKHRNQASERVRVFTPHCIPEKISKRSEPLTRESKNENEEEENECERIRAEASTACLQISKRYDRLVKFITSCPRGDYEEFIEFLLMGGGITENDIGDQFYDDYNSLLFENFYHEKSDYRNLWNDNLTLGLPAALSAREGRKFVPAETLRRKSPTSGVGGHDLDPWQLSEGGLRHFGVSIHNQIIQLDKIKIKKGLGSAVGGASKTLRVSRLVERLRARNTEGTDRCSLNHDEGEEEELGAEELARLKHEAIETCLNATTEHLLKFVKDRPSSKYDEWIEDLHPENAHEGTLLEGLGKTIDHRFFVEVSDHRRIWNENLFTFLDPKCSTGRVFVPARARHVDGNGESAVAPDILSGLVDDGQREFGASHNDGDLIEFV